MISVELRQGRQVRDRLRGAVSTLFGDSTGLALFLGSLVFFGIFWRVDVFMTDSAALVHGLGALGDGQIFIERPAIGASLDNPGVYVGADGPVARNYGQLVLSLPILLTLRAIRLVANLHVAVVAAWHLVVLALFVLVGTLLDRRRLGSIAGSAIVLPLFLLNLQLATQLPSFAPVVLSLQILALLAAAFSAVVCYRLLAGRHDRRLAFLAGGALAVATPVAFWSSLPKRHVFTGLAVLLLLFSIHRSRAVDPETPGIFISRATEYRCLAYVVVGLYAWIHAAEAVFMLGALALVDIPTAPRRDIRTLGAIGIAFGLSVLPMFATNVVVAGDLLTPPRLLPDYAPSAGATPGPPGEPDGGLLTSPDDGGSGVSTGVFDVFTHISELSLTGLTILTTDLNRVFETYVRSPPGAISEMGGQLRYAGANLTILESMPLVAGLFAGIALLLTQVRDETVRVLSGLRTTDALAAVLALTFAVLFAERLPLHAQYTQRYLFPLYPLAIYGLARLSPVRRIGATQWRLAVWSYVVTVSIGGQLFFAYIVVEDVSVGEAFQHHAVLNLGLGALLAFGLTLSTITSASDRVSAIALGLAAAAGTLLVLMAGLVYFPIGPYFLPVVDALNDVIAAG